MGIPRIQFELSSLKYAVNPLSRSYAIEDWKSLVGLQFAFRSMNYAHEVDSNVDAFREQSGGFSALVGAYFDFTTQPQYLKTFLQAVSEKGSIPYVTLDPKVWSKVLSSRDIAFQKTFISRIIHGEFDPSLQAWLERCGIFPLRCYFA